MGNYLFFTTAREAAKNNAWYKVRFDNRDILKKIGFKDISYYFKIKGNKYADSIQFYWSFLKLLFKKKGDVVVMQHPLTNNPVFKFILKAGKNKGVRFICIVIDIESVRQQKKDDAEINREIALLNLYSVLIVHNNSMKKWLLVNNCKIPLVVIGIFDYQVSANLKNQLLNTPQILYTPGVVTKIAFAGNLHKSTFIKKFPHHEHFIIQLYGFLKKHFQPPHKNIIWHGEYSPEELITVIDADWGLIWDGTEADHLDEALGNYLQLNNPHKASLYIVCGLPLMVPALSAVAEFVKQNDIGICINNLSDCYNTPVPHDKYAQYKKNVLALRGKLLQGGFLQTALSESLNLL